MSIKKTQNIDYIAENYIILPSLTKEVVSPTSNVIK